MESTKERAVLGCERPIALITGASSGLGEEYAWQLAATGYDLLLVARREGELRRLQTEIESAYGIRCEPFPCDLADTISLARLEERIGQLENLEFLINNAGFGADSTFPDADLDLMTAMIQVHCTATMRISGAGMRVMRARKKGYIINVSSIAAFLYGTGVAQYSATKAYVLTFTRSIACDAKRHGIHVQALCPGFIHTGFHTTETMRGFDKSKTPGISWLSPKFVVRKSLASVRGKNPPAVYVPSLRHKLAAMIFNTPFADPLIRLLAVRRAVARKNAEKQESEAESDPHRACTAAAHSS